MNKKRSPKPTLPSYEELTGKPKNPEVPARIHAPAAPLRKPPGEMRVYGANPAKKWFERLADTDPKLHDELLKRVENLIGEDYNDAVWAAYIRHYYAPNRRDHLQDDLNFDFSKLFD